jgi:hypothetical protein
MKNLIKSKLFYQMPKALLEKKDILKNISTKNMSFRIAKFGSLNPDKIFYVIKRYPGAGLFSNLTFVINHLKISEQFGFIPVVDMQNFPSWYNEKNKVNNTYNSWEYYFNQLSDYTLEEVYNSQKVIICDNIYHTNFSRLIFEDKDLIKLGKKYIKINSNILKKHDIYFNKYLRGKKFLSVYLRGGEFKTIPNHDFPPTNQQVIAKVKKVMEENKIDVIFLCSKEIEHIDLFKKEFPNKFVYYDSFRSKKDFFTFYPRENHRYLLGEEILCEMLNLSKSDFLIYSLSNVSQAAIYYNLNDQQKRFHINNGTNYSNRLIARFAWYAKSILPESFGGFKKNI